MLLLLAACSVTHGVRPLGAGVVAPELSVGGPLTSLGGLPIPVPLSTLGASVGVTDTADVHLAWHPSAALLTGIAAGELGADLQLLAPQGARPRLMADLTLVFGAGDSAAGGAEGGFRLFVQPTMIAGWDWGKARRQTVYAGLTAFVEPAPGPHVLGAVLLGNRWGIGPRFFATTELKWLAPYADSEPLVPSWIAPGPVGALSLQLGVGMRIGKLPEEEG